MTTKKAVTANPKTRSTVIQPSSLHHRLDTLLHTMRCIAQYEDALCELSHELKGDSALSEEANSELHDILEKIPSHEYLVDLESVRAILAEPKSSRHSAVKKTVKSTIARKGSAATKRKSSK